MNRRQALKLGALGGAWSLAQQFRLNADQPLADRSGRSAILVFLKGGPSHLDMFDMKPEAPSEIRGEFSPISTKIPGVQICEHMPKLARCADQYAILRGVTHNLAAHNLGTEYVFTGNRPGPLLKHPSFGAVVSKELSVAPDVPPFVSIDREPVGPGYLGVRYGPLNTGDKPNPYRPFNVRGLTFDDGLAVSDLTRRRRLSEDLDQAFRGYEDGQVQALDAFSQKAYDIIRSPLTRKAFDLDSERPEVRSRFGSHETGLSMLLACRLVEAGVRFVTVNIDEWDTHQQNFSELKRNLLPRFDGALSAMFQTLQERGLLKETAILVTGEFGRTPKINATAGRDHWPQAMFSLMAGAEVRGGQVIGASDANGMGPESEGFSPDDVAATFYRNIGIDPQSENHTETGRPIQLVRNGRAISRVFTG